MNVLFKSKYHTFYICKHHFLNLNGKFKKRICLFI